MDKYGLSIQWNVIQSYKGRNLCPELLHCSAWSGFSSLLAFSTWAMSHASTPTPTPPLTPAKSFELLCSVVLSGPSSLGSQKGQKRRVGSGVRGDGVWDKPAQEGTKEAVDTPLPLLCTRDNP